VLLLIHISIMRFAPYENFHIISDLKPKEVWQKLTGVTMPESSDIVSFPKSYPAGRDTPFSGSISINSFEFQPKIIYKNAFLPQIKGSFEAYKGGSKIHVKMTLHIFVLIFISIWLLGSGIAFILFFPEMISEHHKARDAAPPLMLLFGYGVTLGAFKSESISSKTFLSDLLSS
jgi:hypothetical protein